MESLKPKRVYRSSQRQSQARETRKQIIEAARELFIERGYVGATIEAIAQQAGVASETVFAVFGNKRAILVALVDISVGGDDQPISLLNRPGPQSVMSESDPIRQLHLFARDISEILERVAPIFEIMRMAAKTEPDIAELLKKLLAERYNNLALFVRQLASHCPLREELNVDQAVEIVWAITSPELFILLTSDREWSNESYIQWLGDTLTRLLLPG